MLVLGPIPCWQGDCNTVLQPCDITFHYSSSPTKTEIKLDTSDMLYAIGVDMIHAITRLHKRVLEPISRPPPDRPLATATSFSKVRVRDV